MRRFNKCNSVDTHELLKAEMSRQLSERQNASSGDAASTVGNTDSGASSGSSSASSSDGSSSATSAVDDTYLYFDSLNRDSDSALGSGQLKYDVGLINNQQPLQNVVSMKITEFFFPRILLPPNFPDYMFFGRIFVRISDPSLSSTQSVQMRGGQQFHYEFRVSNLNSVAVRLEPLHDIFYFQRPISSLSSLVFTYMIPGFSFQTINLPLDKIVVTAIAGSNPGQFSILTTNASTTSLGGIGVPTAPGVAVYFTGFSTVDATLNNLVGSTSGAFVDNIISLTDFSVSAFNFLTLAVNTECTVFIAKNRVAFGIQFTSLRNTITNGLTGIHV